MFTNNADFYPTPRKLFFDLMDGRRYLDGYILEPSAGKGDLIRYMKELDQTKTLKIDAIEKDGDLSSILMNDGINVVWDDFLTYETYKEYSLIIMNPPFSNGVDHMLKALELAENQLIGCEIYAILNKETINNAYSRKRQELLRKLDEHNARIRYVSDAFSQAERKTDVEVALIHVRVAKENTGRVIYDSIPFYTSEGSTEESLETALSTYVKPGEVQEKMNDIERLILEYETACGLAKDAYKAIRDKASFFSYIGNINMRESELVSPFTYVTQKEFTDRDLNEELDRLRRNYWNLILDTDEFRNKLTDEAVQKLNRQLSAASAMEINIPNVRMLLTAISANQYEILIESVVSIFKKITKYHMRDFSSNIHYYNGWKTNDAYKINKKIIIPIKWAFDSWDFDEDYGRISMDVRRWIDDIIKAFQLIDPSVSNDFTAISDREFENDLLRFKMFKNGNIHVWFKDLRLLAKLNYLCGRHFGWIPSEDEQKTDETAREFVAKEFGDIGEVKLIQT